MGQNIRKKYRLSLGPQDWGYYLYTPSGKIGVTETCYQETWALVIFLIGEATPVTDPQTRNHGSPEV